MSEPKLEDNLSDEDIEDAIGELRYVLKNAADKNPVDHQLVMDLTKTLEDLTELLVNKAKGRDPRLGGAIHKIEAAKTMLGIRRRHIRKPKSEPEKKGRIGGLKS